MFSLQRTTVKLTSLNPRAEIHGEDRVPAADLKFEISAGNDVLSEFHPLLKVWLYERPSEPDLADDGESLTQLRFKLLGPLKWGAELSGYTLRVHWGVSGHDDIALADCEVDAFRFDCQDGGSVAVGFRVIAHPSERDMGRLCGLIQREIEISLEEPEAAPMFEDTKGAAPAFDREEAAAWPFPQKAERTPAQQALDEQARQAAERRKHGPEVKYRNPETGETWTGRGKRPKWIEEKMVEGSNLEEFLVAKPIPASQVAAA